MNIVRGTRTFVLAAVVAAVTAASLAAHGLNGTWDLLSKGGPHGDMQFQVTFTHGDGTKLSATLSMFNSKVDMTGEAKDGSFTVKGENNGSKLTMTGKLKADGTLEGFLSNEQGDLVWTGKRAQQ
jgi:hypothetical protein